MTSSILINDFDINIATVNGTGSWSANDILLRSIINMGIIANGKNNFPSNIQGLPTWYTIRVSQEGWIARRKYSDILIAMNPDSVEKDIAELLPGKVVLYDEAFKYDESRRDDLIFLSCPFKTLVKDVTDNVKLRKLLVNTIYVGVLAEIMGLEQPAIDKAIKRQFAHKESAFDVNFKAVEAGRNYVREHFDTSKVKYRFEASDAAKDMFLIEGNEATALGAIFGGASVLAWYPITPASTICEKMVSYAEKYRRDEKGKMTFAHVQAEDELASAGIIIGAGWAGARSITATSGPGISLMSEFVGLAYFAECPAVFVNCQRVGPSTGLPTRTAQSDILTTAYLSHGDTEHIMLIPSSVKECFEMTAQSLDLAEQFQTPVFVMTDTDMGMNIWISEKFDYPDKPLNHGKVLTAEELDKIKDWGRYKDVDGDGIPYRTLPGTKHPKAPYFTRGSGHDEYAVYSESPDNYTKTMDRLKKKIEGASNVVPQPVRVSTGDNSTGFIAFGSSHFAVEESVAQLKEKGHNTSYMLLRALPINKVIKQFIEEHERIYVVEQNRDGQMAMILKIKLPKLAGKIRSILQYDGWPMTASSIRNSYIELEKGL